MSVLPPWILLPVPVPDVWPQLRENGLAAVLVNAPAPNKSYRQYVPNKRLLL